VILYQEQVMQIAQVLSNYTLGAADLLRRAMGKKKPEEMAKQRLIFTEGAKSRGVDVNLASSIFDLMEKFAGYGFNKSHSAAYALLAYQTAWLKAHHPAAFMAAVISADMDHTDKVVILVQECQRMGMKVLPPSITESMHKFTAKGHDVIIYGLGAIKGVGEGAAMALIEARQALGERRGLVELCRCLDLRRVNRRVFDALIKSGCFDEWGTERAQLDSVLEKAMLAGGQFHQEVGQARLFDEFDDSHTEDSHAQVKAWSMKQRLLGEKETLGFYLSGHPADRYHHEFQGLLTPCVALATCGLKKVTVCGVLQSVRRIMTKRGKSLAILSVEDGGGAMDCVVFSEVLEASPNAVVTGEVLVIDGELGRDDYNGGVKLTASMLSTIVEWRTHRAKALRLSLSLHDEVHLTQLSTILTHFPGDTEVHLDYRATTAQGVVKLDKHWCVQLLDELIDELIGLLGDERVQVIF
jgi:DNA polymerase-3 subunit alpha